MSCENDYILFVLKTKTFKLSLSNLFYLFSHFLLEYSTIVKKLQFEVYKHMLPMSNAINLYVTSL